MELKLKHQQMYMRIAEAVALTSSAIRLKVGSVAVKNNKVIGTGYNALPSKIDGDCEDKMYYEGFGDYQDYPNEDTKGLYKLVTKQEVRHSEKNLLLNLAKSTESSEGATIFCTHACCKFCAMDIVDAGIEAFYYKHPYRDSKGIDYLKSHGILVQQI